MDAPLYDVYLTGKLADNTSVAQAAQRLASLFKTTPDVTAGMLTGKPHPLKRRVDKATALKYRDALAGAGVEVAFKALVDTTENSPAVKPTQPSSSNALSLAPAGTEILQPSERPAPATVTVDISQLALAPQAPLPAMAATPAVAPDTSYLSLAASGADLLSDAEKQHPPVATPDIDDLSLAPAGATLDVLRNDLPPLAPDISALSLAPAGTELLSAEQRNKPAPAAPNTDHLRLQN